MIRSFLLSFFIGSFLCFGQNNYANLDKSPLDMSYARPDRLSDPDIRILYSRPQLKGRSIENLAPKGVVWRTGANETTEITFYKDMSIEGKKIPKGVYSLYSIPGNRNWTIVLNTKLHTWGAYAYDSTKDFGRFSAQVEQIESELEVLSMRFDRTKSGYNLVMGWENVEISLPIND